MSVVSRPALRYFGSKWMIAPWIEAHLPEHDCYVEPFAGSACVLLRKAPSRFEVYNDLDSEVVNFFQILRSRADELVLALSLTPWSREECDLAWKPTMVKLERARRFAVRCSQGRFAKVSSTTGWRTQKDATHNGGSCVQSWFHNDHLLEIAERFRNVQIEHRDWLDVVRTYDAPRTSFYLDPPYLPSTRSRRGRDKSYLHEMTEEQHADMLRKVWELEGFVLLSGYDSPLYREILEGWTTVTATHRDEMGQSRTEILWLNPRAASSQRQRSLFDPVDLDLPVEAE